MTEEGFADLVMFVCACYPGWSVEYVEQRLDLEFMQTFNRHVQTWPREFAFLRSFFGYEPPPETPPTEAGRFEQFASIFSVGGNVVGDSEPIGMQP